MGDDPMFHGTTIVALRHKGVAAMAGDGQVTMSERIIMKAHARKVRRIYNGTVLAGFAGGVADALALLDRFEGKLQQFQGQLSRAAVELAKDWRTDRALRRLEAMLVAMDKNTLLVISGSGEVFEPDDDVVAVGSGGPAALAAARALMRHSDLAAPEIARESLLIAAGIDIFTNEEITLETLP